jgi:ubiquinone/menaquinone biosynthesis C-methylase UbiE
MMQTENAVAFESAYIALRRKEQRLFSDEACGRLPFVEHQHPHHNEWLVRERSVKRLCKYISKKRQSQNVLEVGSGNGWLSAKIASSTKSKVLGIDINSTEYEQAIRVFGKQSNLRFQLGSLRDVASNEFDLVIFAASLQYFPSVSEAIEAAFGCLKSAGEVHIIDTHFYETSSLLPARNRSKIYFDVMEQPNMLAFYFHHRAEKLKEYNSKYLYNPAGLLHYFNRNKDPFPWIRIIKP